MTRLALLLLLLLLPGASAHALSATVYQDLGGEPDETLYENRPITATQTTPDGSCTHPGTIEGNAGLRAFTFIEPREESGCARALYQLEVPNGVAKTVQITFDADRTIEKPSDDLIPALVQTFAFHVGDALVESEVHGEGDAAAARGAFTMTLDDPRPPLAISWFFSDRGVTTAQPRSVPTTGVAYSANVFSPIAKFEGVPVEIASVENRSYHIDQSTDLRRDFVNFTLPDMGGRVDLHADQLGADIAAVLGPAGPIPQSRLARAGGVWTITDAQPGDYAIVLETTVSVPRIHLPWLAVIAIGGPTLLAAAAWGLQSRWGREQHERQRRSLFGQRFLAAGTTAALILLAAWAISAQVRHLVVVPLSTTGTIQHLAFALVGAAFILIISQAIVQRNRAVELQHASVLAESNTKLARSNQDLESFAAVASHDLQAPLRHVVSGLELFQMKYADGIDPQGQTFVNMAVDGGKHMQAMVHALLEYGRLEGRLGSDEVLALDAVVQAALYDVRPDIEESGAQVTCNVNGTVAGSRALLRDLFGNLISNAIRYRRDDATPELTITSIRDGGMWRITIADNGRGIEERHQTAIFEMFRRLQAGSEGTGIGLAICKRIVELHKGRIDVDSVLGEGSDFHVLLPDAAQAVEAGDEPAARGRRKR